MIGVLDQVNWQARSWHADLRAHPDMIGVPEPVIRQARTWHADLHTDRT